MRRVVLPALFMLCISMIVPNVYGQQTTTTIPLDQQPTPFLLPDSPWWKLKIAFEDIQIALTFNDKDKALLAIHQAEERLKEIKAMIEKDDLTEIDDLQQRHDSKLRDAQEISARQDSDTRGLEIKQIVKEELDDHEKNVGEVVSHFVRDLNDQKKDAKLKIAKELKEKSAEIENEAEDDLDESELENEQESEQSGKQESEHQSTSGYGTGGGSSSGYGHTG